jgi:hypothetical protein
MTQNGPSIRRYSYAIRHPVADRDQILLDSRGCFPDPLSWEHNLRMAKPWKCRLRLHDWEDRENPETHEHYAVCLRCNAYKERGRAYPGAGAAGMTGTGIGG